MLKLRALTCHNHHLIFKCMAYAYCVNKNPAILDLCVSLKYPQKVCLRLVTAPPFTRHNWASSHPRKWRSQRQNCRSGTWTKVTCFNLGWQRAKGSGEMVSTLTSTPLHSLRCFRICGRLGNVLRLDETDLGSVRNINRMEMLVFFYATSAWLIKPVQSKTSRCKITQGETRLSELSFELFFVLFLEVYYRYSPFAWLRKYVSQLDRPKRILKHLAH